MKDDILTYFGRACVCCGDTRLSTLELDHKASGGNAHRHSVKRQGSSFYREVSQHIHASDHAWLDQLQILCQRCNLSKRDGDHCMIDHNILKKQDDSIDVIGQNARPPLEKNNTLADDELIQVNGRVKPATRKYLLSQGLSIGKVIDALVEEKISAEPTVLRELREIKALILAQHVSTPTITTSLKPKLPWLDPEKLDAWEAFEKEWSQRSQPKPAAVIEDRPRRWLFRYPS